MILKRFFWVLAGIFSWALQDSVIASDNTHERFKKFVAPHKHINNKEFSALTMEYIINRRGCDNITDEGIKALTRVHTVNLSYCRKITDEGIKALTRVHTANLSYCRKITDEEIKALTRVHTIDLGDCDKVTDEGIKALTKEHTINLSYCGHQIADYEEKKAKVLANACVTSLSLLLCDKKSNQAIKTLAGLRKSYESWKANPLRSQNNGKDNHK